jgi:hypothetical protein
MRDFAPAFQWQSLSYPKTVLLVDLSGIRPEVKPVAQGVGFPAFLPGKKVVVGVSDRSR